MKNNEFKTVLDAMEAYRELTVKERTELKEEAPEGARNLFCIMDKIIAAESRAVPVLDVQLMSDKRWNELAKQNKEARKEVIA